MCYAVTGIGGNQSHCLKEESSDGRNMPGADLNTPCVSVVMSVYNGEKYLAEAVQSVLDQTYTDFEFIIVNDGSTDHSDEILRSYADPRIRLIEQENSGLAASLNAGIALARAPYIARQDADDFWYPDKLNLQIKYMELHPNYDIVACLAEIVDNEGEGPVLFNPPLDPRVDTSFAHPSVLIRKSALMAAGGYDARLRYGQDRDLWIRMYNGSNFHVLQDIQMFIRESRARDMAKMLIYPYYGRLVQSLAGVPFEKREEIIDEAMREIAVEAIEIRRRLESGEIDTKHFLDDQYHWRWGNRYLKAGQAARARGHFRNIEFTHLSSWDKVKYTLAFLPGRPVAWFMKYALIVARRVSAMKKKPEGAPSGLRG